MTFWESIKDEIEAVERGLHLRGGGGSGGNADPNTDYSSDSATVRSVQSAINALGYSPALSADGSYGPKTAAGVTWLEQQKGISPATGRIMGTVLNLLGIAPPLSVSSIASAVANWLTPIPIDPIAGLSQAVADALTNFQGKFEGKKRHMYYDIKGKVTTGIGILIDPVSMATALPWRNPDGSLAPTDQVASEWHTVKSAWPGSAEASQGADSQASLTTVRLDDQGIAQSMRAHTESDHATLVKRYPNMSTWPADAQLAVHSIAWPWGAGFSSVWGSNGQAFDAALNRNPPDFNAAAQIMMAASAHEESINPGIVTRNQANVKLFQNAADAVAAGDPYAANYLFFPSEYIPGLAGPMATAGGIIASARAHPVRTGLIAAGVLLGTGGLVWAATRA